MTKATSKYQIDSLSNHDYFFRFCKLIGATKFKQSKKHLTEIFLHFFLNGLEKKKTKKSRIFHLENFPVEHEMFQKTIDLLTMTS